MAISEDSQITCRFTTKLPKEYHIPATEIAVPAKLTRYGLSQVVNHLLDLAENVPLDFLVKGELVRLPLGKFLLSQSISAESVLEVEYIFAVTPPDLQQQIPHDDWIGAINGSQPNFITTGCYDGVLRFWNGQGEKLGEGAVHKGPISAVKRVNEAGVESKNTLLLSAGKLDHVIRLLQVPSDPARLNKKGAACLAVYRGHGGSVLDVAAAPMGSLFASASQDKTLRVWATGSQAVAAAASQSEAEQEGPKKKQRTQNGKAASSEGVSIQQTAELTGHSDAATAVEWPDSDCIYSGSMDHSVRRWDAETGINTDTHNGRKAVSCIAAPEGGRDLVAFAGAAKTLHLWDPRQRHAENAVRPSFGIKAFTSHSSHIHDVAWHPTSAYHLVTASMDKTSKLWDIRSPIPLHTLDGHTEQVLCAAWWGGSQVVSGSADNTVRVYQAKL